MSRSFPWIRRSTGPLVPAALVGASLAHHDPDGRWWPEAHEIEMRQTRPEGVERRVVLRFHREDVTRDGEYIVYEREIESGGVRLPKARAWYMNVDDELLGTDTIVSFTASGGS